MTQLTHPGDVLACRAGDHTVQIVRTELVLRVEVITGGPVGLLVDELTHPYELAHEVLARTIARVLTVALRRGAGVEGARVAVVAHLDAQLAFVLADPTPAGTRAGLALQDEKARWETAEDQAWAEQMLADMRAHLSRQA